ncbi:hypothetical protein PI124_g1264 [Phytophthora idaei]|nr:hypothetical protein PI125_g9529 [Phytophthora idaei]KAG3173564.1 hypothetical protein PI126_g782 [Phytophthora idaei]KAG3254190.1 hypothetical protein PI124_g1264 [Phytophthora idaei]
MYNEVLARSGGGCAASHTNQSSFPILAASAYVTCTTLNAVASLALPRCQNGRLRSRHPALLALVFVVRVAVAYYATESVKRRVEPVDELLDAPAASATAAGAGAPAGSATADVPSHTKPLFVVTTTSAVAVVDVVCVKPYGVREPDGSTMTGVPSLCKPPRRRDHHAQSGTRGRDARDHIGRRSPSRISHRRFIDCRVILGRSSQNSVGPEQNLHRGLPSAVKA